MQRTYENQCYSTDRKEKTEKLSEEFGLKVFSSSVNLTENCEKIVLSVKPNIISSVLNEVDLAAKEKKPLSVAVEELNQGLIKIIGDEKEEE